MMFEVIALNLKTSTSDIKLSTSNLKRSCHDATAPFYALTAVMIGR